MRFGCFVKHTVLRGECCNSKEMWGCPNAVLPRTPNTQTPVSRHSLRSTVSHRTTPYLIESCSKEIERGHYSTVGAQPVSGCSVQESRWWADPRGLLFHSGNSCTRAMHTDTLQQRTPRTQLVCNKHHWSLSCPNTRDWQRKRGQAVACPCQYSSRTVLDKGKIYVCVHIKAIFIFPKRFTTQSVTQNLRMLWMPLILRIYTSKDNEKISCTNKFLAEFKW